MTVEECNWHIRRCNAEIEDCERTINQCKDENSKLEEASVKLVRLRENVEEGSETGVNKSDGIMGFFSAIGSFLRGGLFDTLKDVYRGSQYNKAMDGLGTAKKKIMKGIETRDDEISQCKKRIAQLEAQIRKYRLMILDIQAAAEQSSGAEGG